MLPKGKWIKALIERHLQIHWDVHKLDWRYGVQIEYETISGRIDEWVKE